MSQMKQKQSQAIRELSPGDILDEILIDKPVSRYIVIGREKDNNIPIKPDFPDKEEEYKRVTYRLYLIWCDELYLTDRYKPGAHWTIDQEDLSFDVSVWNLVFKSPLSWKD